MEETRFLTQEGFDKLREELNFLLTVKRPEIAEQIRQSKEDGDLMENAGYDAAKDEQAFLEGRILALQSILKHARIIQSGEGSDYVTLGSRVTVREDGLDPETFQIVGSAEANPREGRISNVSPLGQALLGHRVGDRVEINTPAGVSAFVILEIN